MKMQEVREIARKKALRQKDETSSFNDETLRAIFRRAGYGADVISYCS
jgi:hypothetical protein